jgi:probable rRNA maturation factor
MEDASIQIVQKTKGKLERLPFARMKEAILGTRYELSIAIVGNTLSKKLNRTYRGKDKPTNVLSFPLSKNSGELILTPSVIAREAPKFGVSVRVMTAYLVIHGMLHLKGLDHGSTMESRERQLLMKFGFSLPNTLQKN